jgi:hypothetical protein
MALAPLNAVNFDWTGKPSLSQGHPLGFTLTEAVCLNLNVISIFNLASVGKWQAVSSACIQLEFVVQ